jgi:hypothetical protein
MISDIPDLTPAQVAQFTPIIDDILSNADLSTITPKKIILGLQERLGFDITEFKVSYPSKFQMLEDICIQEDIWSHAAIH